MPSYVPIHGFTAVEIMTSFVRDFNIKITFFLIERRLKQPKPKYSCFEKGGLGFLYFFILEAELLTLVEARASCSLRCFAQISSTIASLCKS